MRLWVRLKSVTRVADTAVPDGKFESASAAFSEKELADLTIAIGLMNAYNRLASDSATHPRQLLECERSTPTGRPFGDRGWFRTELQLRPQDGKCLRAKVGPTLGSRVISKAGMQADKAGELRGSSNASIRNVPLAGNGPE